MANKKIDIDKGIEVDRLKVTDVYVEISESAKLISGELVQGQKLPCRIEHTKVPMNKIRYRLNKALERMNVGLVAKTDKNHLWLELPSASSEK